MQLRCQAPRAGVRFTLLRKDAGRRWVPRVLSPAGPEAQFELRDVSAVDSGNYSCVYTDTSPPFAGSKPSATLELRVDGELRARRPGDPLLPGRLSRDPTGGAQGLRGWGAGRQCPRAPRLVACLPPP